MAKAVYAGKRWWYTRRLVLERDGYRCKIQLPGCTVHARAVDHIQEVSDGGDWYALSNLQAACTPCNTRKENLRRLRNGGLIRYNNRARRRIVMQPSMHRNT
jgi:5-methylcytosine-specific restriction endonuclease McrA